MTSITYVGNLIGGGSLVGTGPLAGVQGSISQSDAVTANLVIEDDGSWDGIESGIITTTVTVDGISSQSTQSTGSQSVSGANTKTPYTFTETFPGNTISGTWTFLGSSTSPSSISVSETDTYNLDNITANYSLSGTLNPTTTTTTGTTSKTPLNFGGGNSGMLWADNDPALNIWFMSGSTITSSAPLTYQGVAEVPPPSWSVAGIGDFGGGDADLLWRNSNGSLVEWVMNGSTITSSASLTYQGAAEAPDSSWNVAGIGDFSGSTADILWQQSGTGALAIWFMNGSTITSSVSPTYQGAAEAPPPSWSIAGIGDFNGDGKSDILWRNSNGLLAEWLMSGSTITSSAAPTYQGVAEAPPPSWSVVAIGNFSGNGDSDILWRNSNGSLAEWLMSGSTITSSAAPTYQGNAVIPDSTWNILEVGNFNGSANTGIVWQQSTTGSLVEWQMNGSQIVSSQAITSGGGAVAPGGVWSSQAKPTDFA